MKRAKKILLGFGCVLFLYIASYFALSAYGRFEPKVTSWGFAWAPKGAVHNYEWSTSFQIAYHSLWVADTHFWHKSDLAESGKYPVHIEVHTNDSIRW
jgi:hypothetical protein